MTEEDVLWMPPGVSTCSDCWHDGTNDRLCKKHEREYWQHEKQRLDRNPKRLAAGGA